MRHTSLFLISCSILLGACHGVQVETPVVQKPLQAEPTLAQRKAALQEKKKSATQVPEVLGGIVQSDEWIIYKEKEQEEFKGHVFYDNGVYTFKANYGLSERKQNTFTATQNVYIRQKEPQGPTYEAWADYGRYNYKTGKGILKSTSTQPVRLTMTDSAQTVYASARYISFDTNAQIFILTGNVYVKRTTSEGTQTLQADKATVKQLQNYLRLDGQAKLSDEACNLEADTIIYDGERDESYAYGARPLATGSDEQGTFTIIADKVTSDAQGNVVKLDGRVQGWIVSPELNNNKINRQF